MPIKSITLSDLTGNYETLLASALTPDTYKRLTSCLVITSYGWSVVFRIYRGSRDDLAIDFETQNLMEAIRSYNRD